MAEGVARHGQVRPGPPAGPDPAATHQFTAGFRWPDEIPWSEIGPDFIAAWAPVKHGKMEGQHIEESGQTGSGKSYALACILHMRALMRDTATIYICTKTDDPTVSRLFELGWPRAKSVEETRRHRQCVFWPQTRQVGEDKDQFFEKLIYGLLSQLWHKNANTIVVFDEVGYVEDLSRRVKKLIRMYWREARALGISVVASKQRPVGVVRDQHSETRWKIVFPPADEADMERFAQLLGPPRDWEPVLRDLDQEMHQFVLRNTVTKETYISWIDFALEGMPKLPQRNEHPHYQHA